MKNELSADFIEGFCHIRTCHATCELCGRDHFGRDGDFDEGELEKCEEAAAADPDKCVDHGDESVSLVNIDGKQAIVECPCNKLVQYENWIWAHRFNIAEYLQIRSQNEARDKAQDAERLKC
jgi:hypothetical protein